MKNKRNIDITTIKMLYAKSGNKCAMPGCKEKLFPYDNKYNSSEIAHIEGVNEGSARFNPLLSQEKINAYDNLILLCPTHHNEIDNKNNLSKYTVEFLKKMKKRHEKEISKDIANYTDIDIDIDKICVDEIKEKYSFIFECGLEEISKKDIKKSVEKILNQSDITRIIIYKILIQCFDDDTFNINMPEIFNELEDRIDVFAMANYLKILEDKNYIKEEYFKGGLESFVDDGEGSSLIVDNNYVYKLFNGSWVLKKKGKILFCIAEILQSKNKIIDFLIGKNYLLLYI